MLIFVGCFAAAAIGGFLCFFIVSNAKAEMQQYYNAAEKVVREDLLEYSLKNPYTLARGQAAPSAKRAFVGIELLGKRPKQRLVYDIQTPISIGRGDSNQIILHDQHISAQHACIFLKKRKVWLRDLRSQCGTVLRRGYFQKIQLRGGKTVQLQNGDRIYLYDHGMRIKLFVYDTNRH